MQQAVVEFFFPKSPSSNKEVQVDPQDLDWKPPTPEQQITASRNGVLFLDVPEFKHQYDSRHDGAHRGHEFERALALLAGLRLRRRGRRFAMASHASLARPFDDLVVASAGSVWALQLKSGVRVSLDAASLTAPRGAFSLPRYFKASLDPGQLFGLEFKDAKVMYGIYTVQSACDSVKCVAGSLAVPEHLDTGGRLLSFDSEGYFEMQSATLKKGNEEEETAGNEEQTQRKQIDEFFSKFRIFSAEGNLEKLRELCLVELNVLLGVEGNQATDLLNSMDEELKHWWSTNGTNHVLTERHSLWKNCLLRELGDGLCRPPPVQHQVTFREETLRALWAQIAQSEHCLHFWPCSPADSWLAVSLLTQALAGRGVLTADSAGLTQKTRTVQYALSSPWFHVLVVRVNADVSAEELHRLCAQIQRNKTIIAVGAVSSYCNTIDQQVSAHDLSEDSLRWLMSRQFTLQGNAITLGNVVQNSFKDFQSKITTEISGETIWNFLTSETVKVGKPIIQPVPYFVSRKILSPTGQVVRLDCPLPDRQVCLRGTTGMGKTQVTHFLTSELHKNERAIWVIHLNFRCFLDMLKANKSEARNILDLAGLSNINSILELNIFKLFQLTHKLAIFVDAIDEIYPEYKDECLKACQYFKSVVSSKGYLWVSTSPACSKELAEPLNLELYSLCRFSEHDVCTFFKLYSELKFNKSCDFRLIQNIVDSWKDNFIQQEFATLSELISTPIQCKFLADLLEIDEDGQFGIAEENAERFMNKIFIDQAIYRLLQEKQNIDLKDPVNTISVEGTFDKIKLDHQVLALHSILTMKELDDLEEGFVEKATRLISDFNNSYQMVGLVSEVIEGKARFTYDILADYLAGSWFAEKKKPQFVKSYYSKAHLYKMWTQFDLLMCDGQKLHGAALRGDAEACKRLLALENPEGKDNAGRTPLHLATIGASRREEREPLVLRELLLRGCDPNARDVLLEWTPLRYAVALAPPHGCCVVEVLLYHGATDEDVEDAVQFQVHPPLEAAPIPKIVDRSRLSKENEAQGTSSSPPPVGGKNRSTEEHSATWELWNQSEHERDEEGFNTLHLTVRFGSIDSLSELLRDLKSLDVNARTSRGMTALHLACQRGSARFVQMLLENGADSLAEDAQGLTPLLCAARAGTAACVRALVHGTRRRGVAFDVDARTKHGLTALHLSCYWGKPEIVKVLLALGADLSATDRHLRGVLHYAARSGCVKCTSLLLAAAKERQQPLDPSAKDVHGRTPLSIAWKVEVLRLLSYA